MSRGTCSLIGEMSVMDSTGHTTLRWNTDNQQEMKLAEETFNQLVSRGYSAFGSKHKSETKHLMKAFDPTSEEVIMVPRNVGG